MEGGGAIYCAAHLQIYVHFHTHTHTHTHIHTHTYTHTYPYTHVMQIQNHNLVGKKHANISDLAVSVNDNDYSWVDNLGVWSRRILLVSAFFSVFANFNNTHLLRGFGLAMFVGMLYGIQFLPVQYLKLCSDSYHSCDGCCIHLVLTSKSLYIYISPV